MPMSLLVLKDILLFERAPALEDMSNYDPSQLEVEYFSSCKNICYLT